MSALRLLLLATGLFLLGCPRPLPSQLATSQLVNVSPASAPSVSLAKLPSSLVYVRAFCKRTASQPDVMGTAFVVGHSDGWSYLISARHVLFPRECGPTPHPLAQRVELRGEGVLPFDGDPSELIEKATDSQGDLLLFHAQGKRDTAMARLSVLVPEMLGSGAEPMDALGFTTLQARSAQPQSERSRGLLSTNNREGRLVLTTEAKLYPSMSGGPVALHSSGLVVGVVLGEYEAQKGGSREGRIATLAPLIDRLPEALRQQLGIVLHYSVSAAYQPDKPKPTWVDRQEQAKVFAVLDAAKPGMEPARVLLHGIGGVGKTTLAYQVAAQRQARFPGGMVKIELTDRPSDLVLDELLEAMTGHKVPSGDRFKKLRALLANRPPVLVILDNVRLDRGPWSAPAAMDALLQSLAPATLIMTTRSRSALAGFASIEVESLPEELAIRMMTSLRAQHSQPSDSLTTPKIVRELGGLPKAIEVAAALLYSKQLREVDMLDRLRRGKDRTLEGQLHELFGWSFAALDGEAQQVLLAMGQLAEAPVPSSLLARLLPDVKQEAAVDRLVASNLAERRHTGRGLEVLHLHTTVWDWARELGPRQQPTLMTALQERMSDSLKTHDEQVAPLLITHILTAQRLAEERQQWDRVLGLMWGTEDALRIFGYWGARKELLQRGLNAAQKGTDRELIANILNNLGNVAKSQGDYVSARKFHQEALSLANALGDRQLIASNLTNLGILAKSLGDYEAARRFYQEALPLANAVDDRHTIASILGNLGEVARLQEDYEAARKFYQEALPLANALSDRTVKASILSNLGIMAKSQGDYGAARKLYQESLDLALALGDRHVIASNLASLGTVAQAQGDYEAARKLYQESLDLALALGDRFVIARVLVWQGLLAAKTGRKAEARLLLDHAIQIFQALGDPALVVAQQERAALGAAPDPVQCRKTCDELQAKGELAVPVVECVRAVCED